MSSIFKMFDKNKEKNGGHCPCCHIKHIIMILLLLYIAFVVTCNKINIKKICKATNYCGNKMTEEVKKVDNNKIVNVKK